jgi:hypothetical protein
VKVYGKREWGEDGRKRSVRKDDQRGSVWMAKRAWDVRTRNEGSTHTKSEWIWESGGGEYVKISLNDMLDHRLRRKERGESGEGREKRAHSRR